MMRRCTDSKSGRKSRSSGGSDHFVENTRKEYAIYKIEARVCQESDRAEATERRPELVTMAGGLRDAHYLSASHSIF